jgi:UDP-2,4-diacetamido-2,4,6-trideoxy-beta-L-altropyranose hydrolase
MRSLAIASAFRDGGWSIGFAATEETFSSVAALDGWPLDRLVLEVDANEEAAAMRRHWPNGADVLVVDHYGRDVALEQGCRGWAERIVVIDDLANRPHDADILVDVANPPGAYRGLVPESCELLSGAEYAIVNETFRRTRQHALARRNGGPVERILVSFGQIDELNATSRALAALTKAGFSGDIDVVLGHAAPHLRAVKAEAWSQTRVHVDTGDMAALMTKADLAIGAGGVSALERCCLGLPSVLLTVAENQRRIVAMLKEAGAAIDIGDVDSGVETRLVEAYTDILAATAVRASMARAAAGLVDGLGVMRIMLAAVGPVPAKDGSPVRLRPATFNDEAWLLALQSQPETRRYSNNPSPPTADSHRAWLAATFDDPARILMVAEANRVPAGMLRLDRHPQSERINIAVDSRYHRLGIGAAILALVQKARPGHALDAEILSGNTASRALFAAAGYKQIGDRLFRREPG